MLSDDMPSSHEGPMHDNSIITMEQVRFSYDTDAVLEDATFSVSRGDFACIVGPNGGGKTTLVKLLLGLLRPDAGTVRVLGRGPRQACSRIGYMPQQVAIDPRFPATVLETVLLGRLGKTRPFGPYRKRDREIAREALDSVGLADLARRNIGTLSGGQRQRALIARALAVEPELLLLDEPASNLDLRIGEELYALLAELNRSITVVVVSHDLAFVSGYVKTVICVEKRVRVHPTREFTDAMVRDLYGGPVRMIRHEHDCISEGCDGRHAQEDGA
jgi:zinc transport system ATP-binding protein